MDAGRSLHHVAESQGRFGDGSKDASNSGAGRKLVAKAVKTFGRAGHSVEAKATNEQHLAMHGDVVFHRDGVAPIRVLRKLVLSDRRVVS